MVARSSRTWPRTSFSDRSNRLWVADLTYVAIPGGFVYLAAVLDAWSRKVVGYAISRSMDARIAVAALKVAIRNRAPPQGCIHHSDRDRNTPPSRIANCWLLTSWSAP